MSDYWGILPLT
jgi:hypothetical protein